MRRTILFLFFCAVLGIFGEKLLMAMQDSAVGLQEDIARLEAARASKDLSTVEKIVDQDSNKWEKKDHESFVRYMYSACSLLSSYNVGDETRQTVLLDNFAMRVIRGGDLSIRETVQFSEFLTRDPLGSKDVDWIDLRRQKARLLLKAQKRVEESLNRNFDFSDRPLLSVAAPSETGLPAGASPDAIRDLGLREKYKSDIAKNAEKIREYDDQSWLKLNAEPFCRTVDRYLETAYSRPPEDLQELQRLLDEYVTDATTRDGVMTEIRKRKQ